MIKVSEKMWNVSEKMWNVSEKMWNISKKMINDDCLNCDFEWLNMIFMIEIIVIKVIIWKS